MEKELINQSATAARIVHVSVPASVAYDFDKITKVQKSILGKLGCMACCSGFDIRWILENRFVVDEKLNINSGGFQF